VVSEPDEVGAERSRDAALWALVHRPNPLATPTVAAEPHAGPTGAFRIFTMEKPFPADRIQPRDQTCCWVPAQGVLQSMSSPFRRTVGVPSTFRVRASSDTSSARSELSREFRHAAKSASAMPTFLA
jgi:hypothetical protein